MCIDVRLVQDVEVYGEESHVADGRQQDQTHRPRSKMLHYSRLNINTVELLNDICSEFKL